jgi:hypothetical protein
MVWQTTPNKQITQTLQDILTIQSSHVDRQTLPRVFVNQSQHPELPAIVGLMLYVIVAPDMMIVSGA